MSTITTIQSSDLISTSRTDINTNFSNLNTDKIETSVLDTDTTLAANSDAKIATQKATKAYADSVVGANASETAKGVVEEATAAEITAGTDTGGTGAKLFVPPSKLNTQITALAPSLTNVVGALANSVVKTYFNIQLPFILWTGSTSGALTTDFANWTRTSTEVSVKPGGAAAIFAGTGAEDLMLFAPLVKDTDEGLEWNDTSIIILDWWAILPSSSTGDINMGFGTGNIPFQGVWDDNSGNGSAVKFAQKSTGELMAVITEDGVGVSSSDISSGLTLTNWNNYRIELDLGNEAKFYVNGTLKATLSGANLETDATDILLGFGRSNTALFSVTAPTLSQQMNP